MSVEIINGSRTSFGPRDVVKDVICEAMTYGMVRQAIVDLHYDDLPAASENDATVGVIPAYSIITRVVVLPATTAFAGGTSYNIGLQQADGTEIDNDGLYAAVTLAQLNAGGTGLATEGALVGASTGANDGQVVATATGTFTAGRAKIIVEYIPQ